MPWRDASPMDQRTQFIADHLRDALPISELCELYGVSRKTGYKWIPIRTPRAGRLGAAFAPTPTVAAADIGRDRDRDPRCPAPASALGRQEALGAAAQAPSWVGSAGPLDGVRSEEHTSELQSLTNLVCRLLLEKTNT